MRRKCQPEGYRPVPARLGGESAPAQPFQHAGTCKPVRGRPDRSLEAADRLARAGPQIAVGLAAIEPALAQKLLQFKAFRSGENPLLARPGLHQWRAAPKPVGEVAD